MDEFVFRQNDSSSSSWFSLELVVASSVIRKGGGGQVGPKNHGFDVLCRRISTQPWKLRILKKRRWSFFLWPWLQSPLRSRSALWDKFHYVSVLCYVVWWDWWAQVWQIKELQTNGDKWIQNSLLMVNACECCKDLYCPNLWIASNYWPCVFCFTLLNPTAVNQCLAFIIYHFTKKTQRSPYFFFVLLCQIPEEQDALLCEDDEFVESKILRAQRFKRSFVMEGLGMSWMITWVNPCQMGCSIWNMCECYEIYDFCAKVFIRMTTN